MTATSAGAKRAHGKALPPVSNGEPAIVPSIPILDISGDAEEEVWDHLFTLDGKQYRLLVNPPASMMMTYMETLRQRGPAVALAWAMEAMLSEGAYEVLLNDQRIPRSAFERLSVLVIALIQGASLADAKKAAAGGALGNANGAGPKASPNGSRRNTQPR